MIEAARLGVFVDGDTSGADGALDRLDGKVRSSAATIGRGALAIGAGFGAAAAGIGAATMKMEDALAPIATLVDSDSKQYVELTAGIKDFVAHSPRDANEIGMAAYTTLSAGITDTTKVMEAMKASGQLAAAGLGDMGQATDLITSAINSFSGEGLDADKAAKLFFGTIASGKTTTSDLAQGFGQIAPLAGAAGIKFNDLLAATAALTSTGQSASVAYSGIKGAITGIIKPTKEASDTAKALGLEFNAAHLKNVGLPQFLAEIQAKTGGNTETMASLFGSVEGLNAVLALTGPQANAFAGNLENIGTAGDKMAAKAAEQNRTLSNTWATLKNNATVKLAGVGQAALNGLFMAKEAFRNFSQTGEWESHSPFETAGVQVAKLVGLFQQHLPQIKQAVADTWVALQAAWEQYGRPALEIAGEVVQIVAARIGDVVGWVRDHWSEISSIISDVLETIKSIVAGALDIVKTLWKNFGDEITTFLKNVWGPIQDVIHGALQVIRGIVQTVTALIHGDWSEVWDGIKKTVSGAWDAIKGAIGLAMAAIKLAVAIGMDVLHSTVKGIWDGIVNFVTGLPDRISRAAGGMWDGIKDAFKDAINWIIRAWNGLDFKIPGFHIGPVGYDGFTLGVPDIPMLAEGGVVTRPTLAMIGERGAEAVVPLSRAGTFGGTTVNMYNQFAAGTNLAQAGREIAEQLEQYRRSSGGGGYGWLGNQ